VLPAAERYVVRVAEAVAAGGLTAFVEPPDPGFDLPLLLHLATAHHLRCAVTDALLAHPESVSASAVVAGLSLEDVKAGRLGLAAQWLSGLSRARRAQALLAGHGIQSVLTPSAAVALMTAGRTPIDPHGVSMMVEASALEAARSLISRDDPRAAIVFEKATDEVLAEPLVLPASFALLVPSLANQERALRAAAATPTPTLEALVALAALTGEPFDDDRARLLLSTAAATRPQRQPVARSASRPSIWVAGFPSLYGGADTELDHLIDLLRARDVDVHLVPMFSADPAMRQSVVDRGCAVHEYSDRGFADRTVVSFCNGEFLAKLPAIVAAGRPREVIWFNCMTWTFAAEGSAHAKGLIDRFGFQSQYQRSMLLPLLERHGPVRSFAYRPYFNPRRVEWRYRNWDGAYRVGRISRDDQDKFAADTWEMFDRVDVPLSLRKEVYILGFGPNAERKIGPPPPGVACQVWPPNGLPATTFYRTIDTMIHKTGGSRESSSRVLLEAYAHGVVPIVERDFAFPELVVHGETGFMASTSDEMSAYAGELARDPDRHRRIAENGRRYLEQTLGDSDTCWEGWAQIL
jgi:hypothetical protein